MTTSPNDPARRAPQPQRSDYLRRMAEPAPAPPPAKAVSANPGPTSREQQIKADQLYHDLKRMGF
jgi:hypothetical protein